MTSSTSPRICPRWRASRPYAPAVVCPAGRDRAGRPRYTHWTFRQLDRTSDVMARGLERSGIGRGTRTVVMVPPSLEFFAVTFALFKIGAVPVLIDPGMGIKNLGRCIAEAAARGVHRHPQGPARQARPAAGDGSRSASAGSPSSLAYFSAVHYARYLPNPIRSPARSPTRPRRSSSPAAARGPPRGWSTRTRSSPRRWRSSATSTGSRRARSTSAPSRCSRCSPPRWG